MENKAEKIAFFSVILGIILFALPSEYIPYALFFLCSGVALAVIKKMWIMAGFTAHIIKK